MAIRKEEEKKVGMKVTDNMDGEEKANEKLDMASVKDIKKIFSNSNLTVAVELLSTIWNELTNP